MCFGYTRIEHIVSLINTPQIKEYLEFMHIILVRPTSNCINPSNCNCTANKRVYCTLDRSDSSKVKLYCIKTAWSEELNN